MDTSVKKNNGFVRILLYPFMGIYAVLKFIILDIFYIFKYALRGIKFFTVDFIMFIYGYFSYNLDSSYRKVKEKIRENEEETERVEKIKKQKVYRYSDRTMAKMEELKSNLIKDLQGDGAVRSKYPNVYRFKAKDPFGKIITSTMSGLSKLDVNAFLLNEGYDVYSIETSKYINFMYGESSIIGAKMSVKDLIFWLTQLSTYLRAGLTLSKSVKILSEQMGKKDKIKQRTFQAITYELTLGESFSKALEKQGKMFPALLINMIKAAEATGTLEETLEDMANYYTEIDKTRKQMISAMTYPSIISIFAIGVVTFILVFVIPEFTDLYASSDAEMNALTAAIINISAWLQENGIVLLVFIVMGALVIFAMYKNLKAFRTSVQKVLMKIPVVGKIIIYNEMTIFAKTFASLLKNNVFITDSMDILSKITTNEIYKRIMFNTINNIAKGDKISTAFKEHWAVPDVAYHMIVTGESTGELAEMMSRVSDYYQEMHRSIVGNLKSFIEPIMISGLAIVVGVILLAVIIPMFGMYDNLSRVVLWNLFL